MAHLSLGSDTGGSIRQPAALCGVVGLKPTYGRVSRYGLIAFASSLDQIGPITKDVRDAALLLEVIAGHDPRDSTSLAAPAEPYLELAERPLEPVRIGVREGVLRRGARPRRSPRPSARRAKVLGEARREGRRRSRCRTATTPIAVYYIIAPAEASSNLARYDGVHYGHRHRRTRRTSSRCSRAAAREGFGPEVQRRIMLGTYALSSGYYDAYYLKAAKVRRLIKQDFDARLREGGRSSSARRRPAPRSSSASARPTRWRCTWRTSTPSRPTSPAARRSPSPAASRAPACPSALQIMANALDEARLLRVARAYERETNWREARKPSL